jgi:type VI protein secretion system component Hcp
MALDLFLTIDGVTGETLDAAFANPRAMELLSFKFGGKDTSTPAKKKGKGKGEDEVPPAQKRTVELFSFSIEKYIDAASPDLLKNYALTRAKELKPFPTAKLSARKPQSNPLAKPLIFFTLEFTNLYVAKYEISLDKETNTPTEDIDCCFSSCVMTYTPQTAAGVGEVSRRIGPMGWDFLRNVRKG